MTGNSFAPYLPRTVRADGAMAPGATPYSLPADDLFGSMDKFVRAQLRNFSLQPEANGSAAARALFVVGPDLAITVDLPSVRPSHVQCLLAVLGRQPHSTSQGEVEGHLMDPTSGLTLWTAAAGSPTVGVIAQTWREIVGAGQVEALVALTTPWLYGNKLRLTRFIAPVALTALPEGAPLLDLMSGTGIVGRALSDRRNIWSNDPNPYAALLSRCQAINAGDVDASELAAALRSGYMENHDSLERLVAGQIEEEAAFLHGEQTGATLEQYTNFASAAVLPLTDGGSSKVARLATERYANVYFGLAQSIEIDSLRIAIERVFPSAGIKRDLCLCALLLACITCATGPHFAQPARAKSLKAFRTIVERRARSITWEFDLALGRLTARQTPAIPMGETTALDWRAALPSFADRMAGGPAGVYIDPPYSKLQYSRYYHVLNVLLAYDYPLAAGVGRYPPRDCRFSSRFEYQPGVARREMAELLRACAERGLTTLLSYGEGGFTSIDGLARKMAGLFARVDVFSEELRHHSQGRRLKASRATVLEHLLVGHPG